MLGLVNVCVRHRKQEGGQGQSVMQVEAARVWGEAGVGSRQGVGVRQGLGRQTGSECDAGGGG